MNTPVAVVGKAPRQKDKRYTRKQLHQLAIAQRREAAAERKAAAGTTSYLDRSIRKAEAAFKGCGVSDHG